MTVLSYLDHGRVIVEVPDVIDLANHRLIAHRLRKEIVRCRQRVLIVQLDDPVVTTTALRVLWEVRETARSRGVLFGVVAHPLARKVFDMTGFEHFLADPAP